MNSIGGYFELELNKTGEYHERALKLNSARNCLRYIIRTKKIKEMWVPKFTCPVVWDTLEGEGCKMNFYSISNELLPVEEPDEDQYILYTNYFGVCDLQVDKMRKRYTNLIIDNAQAFFSHPDGMACFYSPRKFLGVPDGGYLYCAGEEKADLVRDISYGRFEHLLKRVDLGAKSAYNEFKKNEELLDFEQMKGMSRITEQLLSSINYSKCINIRRENFRYIHEQLYALNEFQFCSLDYFVVPMVYPLMIKSDGLRQKLIENGIFVATYWAGQRDSGYGLKMEQDLFPIPIDQRYSVKEMEYIVDQIKKNI